MKPRHYDLGQTWKVSCPKTIDQRWRWKRVEERMSRWMMIGRNWTSWMKTLHLAIGQERALQ
jgi:hypothetical protein